ncbi:MAG: hypothetical protein HFG64_11480 [Lachnospiraceae bacterium]|nr:hypothetical protein [Lachnospiraceae bacterium]
MKILKQITAFLTAAAVCASTAIPAYADYYKEPANIKGVLINSESEVAKAVELGATQVITNFPMSWAYQSDMMAVYERFLNTIKTAGLSATVIVLNDFQAASYNPDLLPVSGPTGANYYAFNTLNEEGIQATRDTASRVVSRFHNLVSNWVIGNEINDGQAWNYIGPMDIDSYCSHYATAFRTWYDVIKSHNSLARVYIPFDFRWNVGQVEGFKYGAMDMMPRLNNQLRDTDYGIAWHAYPEEFDNPIFSDDRHAQEKANTYIINLKNLHILTDYMDQADMLSPAGVLRHLILSEQGFTSLSPANGGECQELQAQCIVEAYQAAAANPHVEAFMLNRLTDVPELIQENYAFGLLDPSGNKKLSWEAYKNVGN